MRLIRNTTPDGRCKYALVRLDKLRKLPVGSEIEQAAAKALDELAAFGLLEYGGKGDPEEFFAIKLKDLNAPETLQTYADIVGAYDEDFAADIDELAERARNHPNRKRPD